MPKMSDDDLSYLTTCPDCNGKKERPNVAMQEYYDRMEAFIDLCPEMSREDAMTAFERKEQAPSGPDHWPCETCKATGKVPKDDPQTKALLELLNWHGIQF